MPTAPLAVAVPVADACGEALGCAVEVPLPRALDVTLLDAELLGRPEALPAPLLVAVGDTVGSAVAYADADLVATAERDADGEPLA